jgi:hypothetical protein
MAIKALPTLQKLALNNRCKLRSPFGHDYKPTTNERNAVEIENLKPLSGKSYKMYFLKATINCRIPICAANCSCLIPVSSGSSQINWPIPGYLDTKDF